MNNMSDMNEMDNFDRWFEAQHGPRPHPHGKDAELVARINAGIEAEAMMRACDMYDAKRKSALYAWTASQWARVVVSKPVGVGRRVQDG